MKRIFLKFSMLVIVLAGLAAISACTATPETEMSVQTQMHECGRIADRGERERCIEAAYGN